MNQSTSQPPRLKISGRSFLAFVLIPQAPLKKWLELLDHESERSKGFFTDKNFILDLRLIDPSDKELSDFFVELQKRNLRIIGVEGGDKNDKALKKWGVSNAFLSNQGALPKGERPSPREIKESQKPQTHVYEGSVRSGQHIVWPDGDLVILGNVASGAEATAGGSIHIYGTLNGRAIAGIGNHANARIYTQKLSAELVAIDGFYATADEMDKDCFGQACCVYLVREKLRFKKIV